MIGTLLSPHFIPWGWAYTPISIKGHDDLFKSLSVRPIVSSIDLISPPVEILKLSCLDLKSTTEQGNSIPLPHCTVVRGYGIFHDISMGLETIWVVGRIFVLDTPPKTSISGYLKVKASLLSHGEDNWLVWRSRPYTIYGKACAFEGQGWSSDHPASIPFTLSFWSGTWRCHTKYLLDALANIFLQN